MGRQPRDEDGRAFFGEQPGSLPLWRVWAARSTGLERVTIVVLLPPETAVRQSWIPTELREDSLEPGEQINDLGWRIVSSQDFHGMHYVVVVSERTPSLWRHHHR